MLLWGGRGGRIVRKKKENKNSLKYKIID